MSSSDKTHNKIENGPLMDANSLGNAMRYVFSGRLALPDGHLPKAKHLVPEDFVGVGVTTSDDPAVDDYILQQLEALKIKQVRLDFTYGDEGGPVTRLLERLLATDIQVLLHLVQPFTEAQQMKTGSAQLRWREFVQTAASRFGSRVSAIEIGSTSNRRRWAGYDTESFFNTWRIAFEEIKSRHIKIAGPNISDFEPLHNIAVLTRLRRDNQLPDIHTNNLFSERVTEPERFDHRIFGTKLAMRLKVNLVKKARILKKITDDFGVKEFISPAAFWTLPRIRRVLVNGEEKQADYLSRYMTLLAASGAMQQAYWGPFICHREGLIDDGYETYPELERITHYRSVLGQREDFRLRPAFYAMQNFIQLIPGSLYEGPLATAEAIEVHAFRSKDKLIHVLWTANGQAMPMHALYAPSQLDDVETITRDGAIAVEQPEFVTESPIFLCWPANAKIDLKASPKARERVSVYRHAPGKNLYEFEQDGWKGLLIAENAEQADEFKQKLHPAYLPKATEETTLRKARNVIWRIDGLMDKTIVAKKPLRMPAHKRLLDKFKPCKSKRSWNAAAELLRRGIPTGLPIAYFERTDDKTLTENFYLCDLVDHDFSAREILTAFNDGATEYQGVSEDQLYQQLSQFLLEMHGRGVFFRDLAGGNILIKKQADEKLEFTLIDINRARFFNRNATLSERLSDLTRICNKLHWQGREKLVGLYLQQTKYKIPFNFRCRLPFYLYDFKVKFKRRYGRKAIKRLFNRLKSSSQN
ncbi:lipopolysaccharide kinase InaA family protein [Methylophaga muralis]|uniref:Lipopolysaccharide kinase (Kdo/WaaP) family protein n=1 Tax=Methylophaga muralis TaxID=291169 RepID=A0A1E3GU39_9GAMM|nr:lipopolysaccharide kinase InaA family protein [Methylophaga muralis]ODN67086.1 Lipopolysaccharide kinase (Kdo/WaaP) family protein [Methylophaga muralis]